MLSTEAQWLEAHFTDMRAGVDARIDAIEAATHRKLDALVVAVHHLLTRGPLMSDHASILADLKKFDTDLDTAIDGAVSTFTAFEATHAATKESLDDIGAIVSGLPSKLDKLKAIKVTDGDAVPDPSSAPVAVTVTAPTTAPTVTIPVSAADASTILPGSTVSGTGIAPGTTVVGTVDVHPSTGGPAITLDTPTTADHAAGDTVTVTAPAAPTAS